MSNADTELYTYFINDYTDISDLHTGRFTDSSINICASKEEK